ncbi:MAG: ribonuclease HII [Campylobacterales bacterium]
MICGIDEVGRGPVAGPLVVVGVILTGEIPNLTDSKKLTPSRREELLLPILQRSRFHLVWISPAEIDRYGLGWGLRTGIGEILTQLKPDRCYIDGNTSFGFSEITPIVKGDQKIPAISAASILGKVFRDRYMEELGRLYPQYQWGKNKGYITKEHKEAILKYGYTRFHRRSFHLHFTPSLF